MINIALDGPSGAGKSTIARAVAKAFGFTYIDTGAMFRSLGLKAVRLGIDIKNQTDLIENMLSSTTLDISRDGDEQHMILDGEDVTSLIRTPEVSKAASDIAVIPSVRTWLLSAERSIASRCDCIMDGRDIGTSVLPDAEVKIFLTASPEARAKRRLLELEEKGISTSFEEVLAEMKYRDKQDASREVSPLKMADDAVLADTTELDLAGSIELVSSIVRKALR